MTTSTRFVLKFFCLFLNNRYPGKLHCTFHSPEKLSLLKEVKPSPDSKMTKLLISITLFRHCDIPAKIRSRMTTAITFHPKMTHVSRASNTQY